MSDAPITGAVVDALFATTPLGLALVGPDLRFVRVNEHLAEINGVTVEAHLGRTLGEVLPEIAAELEPLCRTVLERGEAIVGVELVGETPADPGRERSWLASYAPVIERGRCVGVLAVVEETTTLRRAEEHVGRLLEQIGDAFVAFDRDLRYTYVNRHAAELFGRAPESLVGRLYLEEYPEAEGSPFHRAYVAALADQEPVVFEEHFEPWDRWFENRVYPSADGLAVFFTEITARKRSELELRAANELLEALHRSAPLAISTMEVSGAVTSWSAGGERIFGWAEEDVMGREPVWVPAEREAEARAAWERAAGGETIVGVETQRLDSDGRLVDVSLSLAPLRADDGAVTGIVVVGEDISERKRAEGVLRESEERLRLATGAARMGVWEVDLARGTAVNDQRAAEILGLGLDSTVEEFVGRVHPDDRERLDGEIAAAIAGTAAYASELRIVDDTGRTRWIEAHGTVVRGEHDAPERLIGVLADVTTRKEAEARLREFAERLRLATVTAGLGVWEVDLARRIVTTDLATERMFGYLPGAFGGTVEEVHDRIHPDDLEAVLAVEQATLEEGAPYEAVFRTLAPSGEVRWVQSSATMIRDEHDAPLRLVGVVLDITERTLAEEELRRALEQERESRALLQGTLDGLGPTMFVGLLDAGGVVRYANRPALDAAGLAADDVLGKAFDDTYWWSYSEDVRARLRRALERAAHGEEVRYDEVVRVGEGRTITIDFSLGNVRDADGRLLYLVPSAREISDRARAEAELRALTAELETRVLQRTRDVDSARAEAERANAAKSEFLSRMSHELRTPLNAILGFAQLLRRDELDREQLESVEQILGAGTHLLGLVEELLDVSRIETGMLTLDLQVVSVAEVSRRALELVRSHADERQVVLEPLPDELDDVAVIADRQRLLQVVLNLLSNAVKYNRPGGRVGVSCAPLGEGRVELSVTDTGVGLSPSDAARIFLPFERVRGREEVEGTGLGLAVASTLVEAMGGTLGVESTPGEGSRFFLDLPLADRPPVTADPVATDVTRTVLLIEDNASNVRLVERTVGRLPGTRLLIATTGAGGIALARAERPDLVLLDLGLPDLPGDAVLGRLRREEATAGIPVVIVSADARSETIEQLLTAGAHDYLPKPLDVDRLLELVARF